MELIANYLHRRGTYMARQLNVKGVEFRVVDLHLTDEQKFVVDGSALLVRIVVAEKQVD